MEMKRTRKLLEDGLAQGIHLGGQLYVSSRGSLDIDLAFGESRPGIPMSEDTLMLWLSASKPITAIAIAQLFEQQKVDLNAPLAQYIPEFTGPGKEAVLLRHILTHTAGIRLADKLSPDLPWDEMIARICQTPLEPDWIPGEKAGYSTSAGWYLLGEIVRRITGQPVDEYAREKIFLPFGMTNCWLRLPFEQYKTYGDQLGLMHSTAGSNPYPLPLQDAAGLAQCRPGSSGRGPARELARFYEALLDGGKGIVKAETIELFTQRRRTGLYDYTFLHTLDFGYGFIVDSNQYGPETLPYGYGRLCSKFTFGHSGAQSSCAFADPKHNLVVAWVLNGMPGDRPHNTRARELNTAIYHDLGFN